MMKFKTLLLGTALLASAALGDHYNVKDRFIEPIRYRNVKIDSESYQRPFQLQKKYWVNEKGDLEVYIGHDSKWYKVNKEFRVNERELRRMLKDETESLRPYIQEKIEDIKEWYKRNFKNGNYN